MVERKATGSVNYSASTLHCNPRLHEPNYTQVGQKERRKKAEKLNILPQESSHTNVAYQTTRKNTTRFISIYYIREDPIRLLDCKEGNNISQQHQSGKENHHHVTANPPTPKLHNRQRQQTSRSPSHPNQRNRATKPERRSSRDPRHSGGSDQG
jgi:hypothetical protein